MASKHPWSCVLAIGLAACSGQTPDPTSEGDTRLSIAVGALSLSGVTDVVYQVKVQNTATPPDLVWQRTLRSSVYGDGNGSLTYVGPCDASTGTNTVHLELLELHAFDGPITDWVNPGELVQSARCVSNQDTPVTFDVTLARRASQGFFDVAVNFDDIFCSAKLDCLPALLHHGDRRDTTLVAAFACTTGAGTPTVLHVDAFELACSDGTAWIDSVQGPGNTNQTSAHVFQVATYRGKEALPAIEKAYWNTAIGLDLASFPPPSTVDCNLRGRATASQSDWADGMTPADQTYPYVHWDVEVVRDGVMVCGHHPLDGGNGVETRYAKPPERVRFSGAMPAASCDDGTCDVVRKGAVCSGALAGVAGPVLFASAAGGVIVTMNGQESDAMPLPPGYTLTGCCADVCCQ